MEEERMPEEPEGVRTSVGHSESFNWNRRPGEREGFGQTFNQVTDEQVRQQAAPQVDTTKQAGGKALQKTKGLWTADLPGEISGIKIRHATQVAPVYYHMSNSAEWDFVEHQRAKLPQEFVDGVRATLGDNNALKPAAGQTRVSIKKEWEHIQRASKIDPGMIEKYRNAIQQAVDNVEGIEHVAIATVEFSGGNSLPSSKWGNTIENLYTKANLAPIIKKALNMDFVNMTDAEATQAHQFDEHYKETPQLSEGERIRYEFGMMQEGYQALDPELVGQYIANKKRKHGIVNMSKRHDVFFEGDTPTKLISDREGKQIEIDMTATGVDKRIIDHLMATSKQIMDKESKILLHKIKTAGEPAQQPGLGEEAGEQTPLGTGPGEGASEVGVVEVQGWDIDDLGAAAPQPPVAPEPVAQAPIASQPPVTVPEPVAPQPVAAQPPAAQPESAESSSSSTQFTQFQTMVGALMRGMEDGLE
ncbi:hypothetical protein ACFLQ2_05525 [archaeon]